MNDLNKIWQEVTTHLNTAFELLSDPKDNPEGGSVESFDEYISHNELELALDELEGLADVNKTSNEFWLNMIKATDLMNLNEHKSRFESKLVD